jgi:Contractile injection system tube protein
VGPLPEPATIAKAELWQVRLPDRDQPARDTGRSRLTVDFNPATLKVVYSNSFVGKDQRGGAALQFVTKSSTRLSVELWFDVTTRPGRNDVRDRTELVKRFLVAAKVQEGREEKLVPPGVRFIWGSFVFEGVMETMDESLELFSPDGRPLRARVSISISSQEIQERIDPSTLPGPGGPTPGTTPRQQVRQGESVQQLVGRSGNPDQWPEVAEVNGIEQPRLPPTGLRVDVHARR